MYVGSERVLRKKKGNKRRRRGMGIVEGNGERIKRGKKKRGRKKEGKRILIGKREEMEERRPDWAPQCVCVGGEITSVSTCGYSERNTKIHMELKIVYLFPSIFLKGEENQGSLSLPHHRV